MTRRPFIAGVLLVLTIGAALRLTWLTSDPPTTAAVGVVWHDEGAWVHNARNRALWGAWRTDNWNPMFLAPVFTGLEYGAFRVFGVGTWQARVVPAASGLAAIAFLMAGLNAMSGPRTALIGGALLATNYVSVMWDRAALMESTMTSFMVIGWASYALAARRPQWGLVAGTAAALAFFTKASAAFFVAAVALEAVTAAVFPDGRAEHQVRPRGMTARGSFGAWTLAGLILAGTAIAVGFVLPHWSEYRFYTWQMSVERKPEYAVRALMNRASWLPLVHDFFTWMWPLLAAAAVAIVRAAAGWRDARPAERLLVLWVVVGLVEVVVHDSGNARRYVMFMPALIALATDLLVGAAGRRAPIARRSTRWVAAILTLGLGYLVAGAAVRSAFLEQVRMGHLHTTVVLSMGIAALASAAVALGWSRVSTWLAHGRVAWWAAGGAIAVTTMVNLGHLIGWAGDRDTRNYDASIAIGHLLAPGTLVHGKLANGLSLENRIRPIFIGHGFGNYDDRLQRDDVRYILTYVSPSVGYESQAGSDMIQEILNRYPHRRTVATLTVNETGGPDRAALIDKVPGTISASDSRRLDQSARRSALSIGIRLRAFRVLPQR